MKRVNVLDKGFVELVDHMGSDQSIVNSARVSVSGDEVKAVSTNRQLIRYLLRHRHTTPFESVVFTFAVKAPILTFRQWHRHRTQAYNEMSARYGVLPDEFYIPELTRMNPQADKNHQGSKAGLIQNADTYRAKLEAFSQLAYSTYLDLIDSGLARELARNVIPVNVYSKMYCTVSLHNLFHFLKLRLDGHAQEEIRVYAQAMLDLIRDIVPEAVEAFEDYLMGGVYLNRLEIEQLRKLFSLSANLDTSLITLETSREREEFLGKIKLLGGGNP